MAPCSFAAVCQVTCINCASRAFEARSHLSPPAHNSSEGRIEKLLHFISRMICVHEQRHPDFVHIERVCKLPS